MAESFAYTFELTCGFRTFAVELRPNLNVTHNGCRISWDFCFFAAGPIMLDA
jgi:hypothetical protein